MAVFDKLSAISTLRVCKNLDDDKVLIVAEKPESTLLFIKTCSECFPEHTKTSVCTIDDDLAVLVLTK